MHTLQRGFLRCTAIGRGDRPFRGPFRCPVRAARRAGREVLAGLRAGRHDRHAGQRPHGGGDSRNQQGGCGPVTRLACPSDSAAAVDGHGRARDRGQGGSRQAQPQVSGRVPEMAVAGE